MTNVKAAPTLFLCTNRPRARQRCLRRLSDSGIIILELRGRFNAGFQQLAVALSVNTRCYHGFDLPPNFSTQFVP